MMKKISKISSGLYIFLCFAFFYLPILVTVIFSFNSSKSLTHFSGFSMRWYSELINSSEIMSAVYVSLTIAIISTVISTILGTSKEKTREGIAESAITTRLNWELLKR